MSLCINPKCLRENPDNTNFCNYCGSGLLLDGRYRVVRPISEKGGFGKTYEVIENSNAYVLKVLIDNSAIAVKLFKREAEVLQELQHPGIPRRKDYFLFYPKNSQEPLYCLVMEKIFGDDLENHQDKSDNRPISQKTALEWL
ncbi:MAG: hypothetical protein F6J93_25245 [Oscillatoria sp. SIO1A7]|nr:hypothetical protein [Oscillatoria sp. SIO1A7]